MHRLILGLVNKLSSIFGWLRLRLAVSALSSLNQKRNLISLPVLTDDVLLSLSILFHILGEFDSVSSTHSVLTEKFRKGYTSMVDFLRFRLIYMLVTRQEHVK